MNDDIKRYSRFIEIYRNFENSEAYTFYQQLIENRSAISILKMNFRELERTVEFHNKHVIKEALDSTKHLKILWRTQREITRLISNYLSSVSNQISYGRFSTSLIKKNEVLFRLLKNQLITRFDQNWRHKFIIELRNYVTHEIGVKVVSEYGMRIEWDAPRSNFYVDKQRLLKSHNWKSSGKEFLQKNENKVYLFNILQQHHKEFLDFQNEIYLALFIIDIEKTNSYITSLKNIYQDCNEIGYQHALPFNQSYLRYLDYVNADAQHIPRSWEKQEPTSR